MTPNPSTALTDVADAIRRLAADRGLVVTGELHAVAPQEPGRVEVEATIHDGGPLGRLTLVARPAPGAPVVLGGGPTPPAPLAAPAAVATLAPATEQLRMLGYTGNVCVGCGGTRRRRRGTCETCEDCGATSGCG